MGNEELKFVVDNGDKSFVYAPLPQYHGFGEKIEPTTKNNLVVDAVSKKEVINTIRDWWKTAMMADGEPTLCDSIRDLPSVTPLEPRWIPTSERLPDEDGEYFATVYDTDENYKYMDIAEFEDGIWQYKDYVKVLAWMPKPKPYKAESEAEDGNDS